MKVASDACAAVLEVLGGHADDSPVDAVERVAPVVAANQRQLAGVELVALVLDADPLLGPRSVESSVEAALVPDLVLRYRRRKAEIAEQPKHLRLHRTLGRFVLR